MKAQSSTISAFIKPHQQLGELALKAIAGMVGIQAALAFQQSLIAAAGMGSGGAGAGQTATDAGGAAGSGDNQSPGEQPDGTGNQERQDQSAPDVESPSPLEQYTSDEETARENTEDWDENTLFDERSNEVIWREAFRSSTNFSAMASSRLM